MTHAVTFANPEVESAYRNSHATADRLTARACVLVTIIGAVLFVPSDYQRFGTEPPFHALLSARIAVVAVSVLTLIRLRRPLPAPTCDRAMLAWGAAAVAQILYVTSTRPPTYLGHAVVNLGAVFLAYTVIPMPLAGQVVLAGSLSVGCAALAAGDGLGAAAVGWSFLGANVLGIVVSRRLHRQGREAFAARRRLEQALAEVRTLRGLIRVFEYDAAGRKTTETWKDAGGATVRTQTFGYDDNGNLTSATDPGGSYAIDYDVLDRPIEVDEPFGVGLTFGYDAAGNRTTVTDSQSGVVTSVFDLADRLTSRRLDGPSADARVDSTYTPLGAVDTLTRYADLAGTTLVGTTEYDYDAGGRVTGVTTKDDVGATLLATGYGYDLADRLTSRTEGGVTTTYTYDAAGQLTGDGATTFAYDATGNRTGAGVVVGDGNRVLSDGTWAYTYDDAGQLVKKSQGALAETWTYAYDHAGRLTGATRAATDGGSATATVGYAYDALGNRASRTAWDGTATVTERFAYDGWDPAKPGAVGTEGFDAWAEVNGSGAVTSRRAFGAGFDEPVAVVSGSTAGWYAADLVGSVRLTVDATGAATSAATYDAFGNLASGTRGDRYGYAGREWDGVLGQSYHRARVYDPAAGRWWAEDPLGFGGGDTNLYRYAGNRPTDRTDPSGMQPPGQGGLTPAEIERLREWQRYLDSLPPGPLPGGTGSPRPGGGMRHLTPEQVAEIAPNDTPPSGRPPRPGSTGGTYDGGPDLFGRRPHPGRGAGSGRGGLTGFLPTFPRGDSAGGGFGAFDRPFPGGRGGPAGDGFFPFGRRPFPGFVTDPDGGESSGSPNSPYDFGHPFAIRPRPTPPPLEPPPRPVEVAPVPRPPQFQPRPKGECPDLVSPWELRPDGTRPNVPALGPSRDEGKALGPHELLDGIGMAIDLADALNAVLYALEGEFQEAGISMAGMIPFIGQAATARRLQRHRHHHPDPFRPDAEGIPQPPPGGAVGPSTPHAPGTLSPQEIAKRHKEIRDRVDLLHQRRQALDERARELRQQYGPGADDDILDMIDGIDQETLRLLEEFQNLPRNPLAPPWEAHNLPAPDRTDIRAIIFGLINACIICRGPDNS